MTQYQRFVLMPSVSIPSLFLFDRVKSLSFWWISRYVRIFGKISFIPTINRIKSSREITWCCLSWYSRYCSRICTSGSQTNVKTRESKRSEWRKLFSNANKIRFQFRFYTNAMPLKKSRIYFQIFVFKSNQINLVKSMD